MKRSPMKQLPQGSTSLLCSLLIIFLGVASVGGASDWEIDARGTVDRIVDGDTFHAVPVGRVRLADIDTPEVGEPGAKEATEYLASLVHLRLVYLDVDDLHGTDRYGRVVAVVFVRYNTTHLLNVNKALLRADLADLADFPNEFNPATWTNYVHHPAETSAIAELPAAVWMASTAIFTMTTFAVLVMFVHFRRRLHSRKVASRDRQIQSCPDSKH